MDFMGIGLPELLFVLFIALMVFGPGKMPEFARTLGKAMRTLKMATSELSREITQELNKEIKEIKDEGSEIGNEISGDLKSIGDGIKEDVNPTPQRDIKPAKQTGQESESASEEDRIKQ